jgi:hypothetical protein
MLVHNISLQNELLMNSSMHVKENDQHTLCTGTLCGSLLAWRQWTVLLRTLVLFLEHLDGIFSSCAKLKAEVNARVNWCVHADTHACACAHTHKTHLHTSRA